VTQRQIRVYFSLQGLDPDEVTETLGVQPSKVLRAGTKLRSGVLAPCDLWEVRAQNDHTNSLNSVISDVLDFFANRWPALLSLSERAEVDVEIAIYREEDSDLDLTIEPKVLSRLNELRSTLRFYCY
jgi:hypothetical protein